MEQGLVAWALSGEAPGPVGFALPAGWSQALRSTSAGEQTVHLDPHRHINMQLSIVSKSRGSGPSLPGGRVPSCFAPLFTAPSWAS